MRSSSVLAFRAHRRSVASGARKCRGALAGRLRRRRAPPRSSHADARRARVGLPGSPRAVPAGTNRARAAVRAVRRRHARRLGAQARGEFGIAGRRQLYARFVNCASRNMSGCWPGLLSPAIDLDRAQERGLGSFRKEGFTAPTASGLRGGPAANPWRQAGFGSPGP
jgi:hypothetical protein